MPGCKARPLHPCEDARPLQGPLQRCKAIARRRLGVWWGWGETRGNAGENKNLLSHRFCCRLIPLLEANSIARFSSHCIVIETMDLRSSLRKGSTILLLHTARRSEAPSLAFALKRIAALPIYLLHLVAASEISTSKWLLPGSCKGLDRVQGPCKGARPLQGPLQGCKALCRGARPLQGRCKRARPLQGCKALVRPPGFYPDARPLQACMALARVYGSCKGARPSARPLQCPYKAR